MIKNLFFDLDGTILDSLEGIRVAINKTLEICKIEKSFSYDDCKFLIGDGAETLIKRALGEIYGDNPLTKKVRGMYYQNYKYYQSLYTKTFPGLLEVLEALISKGINCFVITNKPDDLAQIIVKKYFGDLFKDIRGIRQGDKVKPNPQILDEIINKYSLNRDECLYVGDSHVDIETAKNANLESVLCLWGYETNYEKYKKEATHICEKYEDLLNLIL